MFQQFFTEIPLWGFFLVTFILMFIAFEGGVFLGKVHRKIIEKEDRTPVGSIVAATLGLLAFLLAFTFGLAANQFEKRRELVVEEANAISTTYLRAGYLKEPHGATIKQLLEEYVSVRLKALQENKTSVGLEKVEGLQKLLWEQAETVAKADMGADMVALFVESLNDVFELHAKRINTGLRIRIPAVVWGMLLFVTFLAFGSVGYQIGLTHSRFIGISALMILTFTAVIVLIADLDRPQEGVLKVSQQSLIDLQQRWRNN
jgi:hypothetical protein